MVTQLVISMIFATCEADTRMYLVQDEKTDCITYYADCVIDNKNEKNPYEVCKNEAKNKLAK